MSTIAGIKKLIRENELGKALKELDEWSSRHDQDLNNDVIMLMARYNSIKTSLSRGLMSNEEAHRMQNQLNYSLLSLLEDVDETADLTQASTSSDHDKTNSAKKIFISYAREDREYVVQLENHLASLRNSGHVDSWNDSNILAGQEWYPAIESQIRAAEIIIYMVSAYFLNSSFISKNERPWAEETRAKQGARIVPIIARYCDWHNEDFAKYNALPKDPNDNEHLKPISSWADKDEAFYKVTAELRRIIDKK